MGGLGGAATGGIGSMFADSPEMIAGTQAGASAVAPGSNALTAAGQSTFGSALDTSFLSDPQAALLSSMQSGTPISDPNMLNSIGSLNDSQIGQVQNLAQNQNAFANAAQAQMSGMAGNFPSTADQGFMNYKTLMTPGDQGGGLSPWWSSLSGAQKIGLGGAGILGLNTYLRSQTPQNYNPNQGPGYQFNYAGFHPYLAPNFAAGGSVGVGQNTMYPQSQQSSLQFAQPTQLPATAATMQSDVDTLTNPYTGEQTVAHMATGGISNLGSYSDGGRLLKGPGDGVSDDIPASIGGKQPARLADGEFVVPARIVSELGNGSTDAGARALYKMMNRVQANRAKTVGEDKMSIDSKSDKFLPA